MDLNALLLDLQPELRGIERTGQSWMIPYLVARKQNRKPNVSALETHSETILCPVCFPRPGC